MLQNVRFSAFTIYELLRKNQQGGKNTSPRLGLSSDKTEYLIIDHSHLAYVTVRRIFSRENYPKI